MTTTRRAPGLALGLSILASCASSPESSDDAVIESTSEAIVGGKPATMYPEAGYLDIDAAANGSKYVCSAALIAPRVVLTAGHCVDRHSKWEFRLGSEVRTSTAAVTYDWKDGGSQTINPAFHDIGLVFLDQPINIALYPTIARQPLANGSKVTNVGRINNGVVTNSLYSADTTVTNGAAVGHPYAYSSPVVIQQGDSGGPDFAAGSHTIVAVNSGANATLQLLARVDLVADWILAQVASRGGAGNSSSTPPVPACPADVEPNNTWARARELPSGESCGALTEKDEDWFRVTAAANSPVRLALGGPGDAVFEVGQGNASSCRPAIGGLREISMTAPLAQILCVRVVSPRGTSQSYSVTRK